MKYYGKNLSFSAFTIFVVLLFLSSVVFSQSTDQLFPTPITSNEVVGKIKARDIGDSRLTTFYYTFNGEQGDVFINVVTNNFSGDIDIFSMDGAKTFTKIVVYADATATETGRVVYLRKSEKLLLRIQGRSPNDDDAGVRIKFAGSFQAINAGKTVDQPKLPEIKEDKSSGIRVNSVGTIVEVIQKPKPLPKEIPAKAEEKDKAVVKEIAIESEAETAVIAETSPEKTEQKTAETAVNTNKSKKETKAEILNKPKNKSINEKIAERKKAEKSTEKNTETGNRKKPKEENESESDPLTKIRLVVLFKDGTKIERPMSEILKFGVEKGILTIISKDGSIGRYSILEVEKMTVQ